MVYRPLDAHKEMLCEQILFGYNTNTYIKHMRYKLECLLMVVCFAVY